MTAPFIDPNSLTPAQLAALYDQNGGVLNAPQSSSPAVHGLLTDAIQSTPAPTPQAGLLGRVGGAIENGLFPAQPGVSDAGTAAARRQALLNLGLAMMQASAPRPGLRPTFGSILAQSVPVGQQTYADQVNQRHLAELHDHIRQAVPLDLNAPLPEQLSSLGKIGTMYAQAGLPEAAGQVAELMSKMKAAAQTGQGQMAQAGDMVTTFDPAKGFYDPKANNGAGGWVPSIDRGVPQDKLDEDAQNRELRRLSIENSRAEFEQRQNETMAKGFITRVKPITDKGAFLAQASAMLRQAATNPVAYASALTNFVMSVDQRPQLRYQMLEYFSKELDPSVEGRWELFKNKVLSGKYPPQTLARMAQVIETVKNANIQQYNAQRAAEVKRHPDLDSWLPTEDEFFMPSTANPQTASPNAPATAPATGYSPNNPFAPKP